MLARVLEAICDFFYAIGQRRWVSVLCIAAAIGCIALIAFGRAELPRAAVVNDVGLDAISIAHLNTYMRVSGTLVPARAFQTRFQLGPFGLLGSRFIPITQPGITAPLFVLDEGVPPGALSGAPSTLVGRLVAGSGTQQPSFYLQLGSPPNTLLLSAMAAAGLGTLALLLLFWLASAMLRRIDYVIEMPFSFANSGATKTRAPQNLMLWFGELGREFDGVQLRHAPVTIIARSREARFEVRDDAALVAWSQVRRIIRSHPAAVASRYGFLPAERIEFEDERGLPRLATLAFGSPQAQIAVLEVLKHIGHMG